MKPSVLVAVGCSWVAAKCIDRDPAITTPDYDHVEDPAFVQEHSFAGQLQRRLGLDELHFIARHGASNEEQVRKLINFVKQNEVRNWIENISRFTFNLSRKFCFFLQEKLSMQVQRSYNYM